MNVQKSPIRLIIGMLALLAVLISSAVVVSPVSAATIVVTTFDDVLDPALCSLRDAIKSANDAIAYNRCTSGTSGADTIVLEVGTYTLEIGQLPEITSEITILGEDSRDTIIQASDCDPTDVAVTCTHEYRVLQVAANGNLTLEQVTIRHGDVSGNGVINPGGGIRNTGILNLKSSTVSNNKANLGGGIQNNSEKFRSLTIEDSLITGNVATHTGGGIHNIKTDITLVNSTIENNTSLAGGGGISNSPLGNINLNNCQIQGNTAATQGGGIYSIGILSLNNNTQIFGNKAQQGGGIFLSGGDAETTITRSNIEQNQSLLGADGRGGGIYSANVSSLSIERSTISENESSHWGGGVFILNSDFSLDRSILYKNGAKESGGGIYIFSSVVVNTSDINDSTFDENQADVHGGGIYNGNSELTLVNSTLKNNEAGGSGGAIYNFSDSDMVIIESTFSGNTADEYGGGIYNHRDSMTISSSTLINNTAEFNGGGFYNTSDDKVKVEKSTFMGNEAGGLGGGIYNSGDDMLLENSTLSENEAINNSGGGIANFQGGLTLRNCTLWGNITKFLGGGIYNYEGDLDYANTIIANSVSDDDCVNIGAISTIIDSHNLVVDHDNCGTPLLTVDPMLDVLGDNGGPTLTHAFRGDSPAIDAGSSDHCPATDQRGVDRPQGEGCDIGAFELEQGFTIFLPLILR